jgi:hypothetical protein
MARFPGGAHLGFADHSARAREAVDHELVQRAGAVLDAPSGFITTQSKELRSPSRAVAAVGVLDPKRDLDGESRLHFQSGGEELSIAGG